MAIPEIVFGALAVFLATSFGSLAVLLFKCIDPRKYSIMLAFSAGVMAFSAVEMLTQSHQMQGDIIVLGGFVTGIFALLAADKLLPHIHRHIRKKDIAHEKKKSALIAGTIALHNIPEGLAIATAFAASSSLGWFVTTSIAIQDIPEGALVSVPLACYGMNNKRSMFFGIVSAIAEAGSAIIGFFFLSLFAGLVPLSLSFSAGAMAYVVLVELLADAFSNGNERTSAVAFIAGAIGAFLIAGMLAV